MVWPSYVAGPIPGEQSAAIIERLLEYDLRGPWSPIFTEAVADAKASTAGSFAMRLDYINKLVGALRGVLQELVVCPGKQDALRERCEVALVKANLKPEGLRKTFLIPFVKATKAT